jgi:hypothetical protein
MDETLKPARRPAPLRRGARYLAVRAALLVGLAVVAACGQVSFNRETGQFSVPLGGGNGGGQGSNR